MLHCTVIHILRILVVLKTFDPPNRKRSLEYSARLKWTVRDTVGELVQQAASRLCSP